jgi:hypothetical protein
MSVILEPYLTFNFKSKMENGMKISREKGRERERETLN